MQILVLGMHRSGTSAITRLIHMMGAWLGDENDIMPANEHDNPTGYWERLGVFKAHDNLLQKLNPGIAAHYGWIFVANLNAERLAAVSGESIDPLRAELAILDAHRPWVAKDPRLCLLLPVWQALLSEPVYVLMYRHPLEVARSLANRANQPLPVGFGLVLWEKYVLSALQALQGKRVLVVSHRHLLAEPWQQCQRLHAYLQASAPGLQLPSPEQVEAFINPRLHHVHRDAAHDALWLTPQQMAIDEELERYAARPGAIVLATTPRSMPDARLAEYEQLEESGLMLLEQQQKLQARDSLIQEQQAQLERSSELAVQQNAQLLSVQEQIQRQRQQMRANQDLTSQLQQQNEELREHARLLNESLAALRGSWTWRLKGPLRSFLAALRRED